MRPILQFLRHGDPALAESPAAPSALLWVGAGLLLDSAFALFGPLLGQRLFDAAAGGAARTPPPHFTAYSLLYALTLLVGPCQWILKGRFKRAANDWRLAMAPLFERLMNVGDVEAIGQGLFQRARKAVLHYATRNTELRFNMLHVIFHLVVGEILLFALDARIAWTTAALTIAMGVWLERRARAIDPLTRALQAAEERLDLRLQELSRPQQLRQMRVHALEATTFAWLKPYFIDEHARAEAQRMAVQRFGIFHDLFSGALLMAAINLFCVTSLYLSGAPSLGKLWALLSLSAHIQFKLTTLGHLVRDLRLTDGSAEVLRLALGRATAPWPTAISIRTAAVHCAHVCCTLNGTNILRNVDLAVAPGELVVIDGKNGVGKTTLLRLLAGLETPTQGLVEISGYSPRHVRGAIALVDQEYSLLNSLSLAENLARFAPHATPELLRSTLMEAGLRRSLLNDLEVSVRHFSGGQRQTVALACALLRKPKLLLLDEPAAALDAEARARLEMTLEKQLVEGVAIVVVSHVPLNVRGRRLKLEAGVLRSAA